MSQKNVLITGGSTGIGAAIAQRFEQQGDNVFNLDWQNGQFGKWLKCDLTVPDQLNSQLESLLSENDIQVLVCNAGRHMSATIEQTSPEDFEALFNLNVKSAFTVTQKVLPQMKNGNWGRVIYIASDQATIAKPNSFAYNLTKHALASMAKTTALDYAEFGITANAVCPGTIDTPLYQSAIKRYCDSSDLNEAEVHQEEAECQPVGRIGQPEEVAAYVAFLASEDAGFITGSLQAIDGGYTAK
jgi:NAD(P)-dependent dehydrogenase (short-subunit alcohol dehydrogenase family)